MEMVKKHWGEWVLTRAQYVGHRRQIDLAKGVGCTQNQISRWLQLSAPPKQMRKGFDWKLAWALKTSHEMLFKDWVNTPPEKAREFIFKRPDGRPPPEPGYFDKATDRQLLEEFFEGAVLPNLSDQQLEELLGSSLVLLAMSKGEIFADFLRGFDHPFLDRLKSFFAWASKPARSGQGDSAKMRSERPPTREEFKKFLEELRAENASKSATKA